MENHTPNSKGGFYNNNKSNEFRKSFKEENPPKNMVLSELVSF